MKDINSCTFRSICFIFGFLEQHTNAHALPPWYLFSQKMMFKFWNKGEKWHKKVDHDKLIALVNQDQANPRYIVKFMT